RQLQKMVHDIKNNEGGIMNKIKKLKVKAPPSVPQRDYASGSAADEEEQWSDDFDGDYENPDEHSDSEMYVMPAEENGDDSYEPPPVEQETRTVQPALPFARGEYVDNRSSQRQSPPISKTLPSKPSWPSSKARLSSTLPSLTSLQKPQVPPKPKELLEDEADYLLPPETLHKSFIDSYFGGHPPLTAPPNPSTRAPSPLTEPSELGALDLPRGVCAGRNSRPWESKLPSSPAAPCPLPRAGKKPATPLKITPIASQQNASSVCEEKPIPAERHRGSSHRQEAVQSPALPPAQKQIHQKPIPLPRFPEMGSPTVDGPLPSFSSNCNLSEQEAEVYCKPWYAGACDRKSAEEALYKSNKDGSFLIRKSSGQDSKQPYTLVVFFNKRVYNVPVRFIEATKQYALGRKKTGEEYFESVAEIIKNHQHNPLVLIDSQNNTKDSTRLKYAVKIS
uniref:B cell linker n=1 Tax=Loxodonta africana TaxID=9785 RepID=G3U0G2_LOXAF